MDVDKRLSSQEGSKESKNWLEIVKAIGIPLVTLILGFTFNQTLNSRQEQDARVRLYTEMMTRREQDDSALRKDLVNSILDAFIKKGTETTKGDLDREVLNLELLASNARQSLDISPLFKSLRRKVQDEAGPKAEDHRTRLEKIARKIVGQQLTTLEESGMVEYGDASITDEHLEKLQAYIGFGGRTVATPDFRPGEGVSRLCLSVNSGGKDFRLHYRQFKVEILEYDSKWREVRVRMYVSKLLTESDCKRPDLDLAANREVDTKFSVGLFDFPSIDNAQLSYGERCSVSMTNLNPSNSVGIAVAYFPDSRARLEGYYEGLVRDLVDRQSTPLTQQR